MKKQLLLAISFAITGLAVNAQSHLEETGLLDYSHPTITKLVENKGWMNLPEKQRIGAIYDFIQNDIKFGYNKSDDLKASEVLKDGYGQCNTKGTLFMALLRSAGIPARFRGFAIDKKMQRGALTGVAYQLAPNEIIHSWVEVLHNKKWIVLEGFILDQEYLKNLQKVFKVNRFCGYGVATDNLQQPKIYWNGDSNTYIQKMAITKDYGIFDSPDKFYAKHGVNVTGLRAVLFDKIIRHQINANVASIRHGEAQGKLDQVCQLEDIQSISDKL